MSRVHNILQYTASYEHVLAIQLLGFNNNFVICFFFIEIWLSHSTEGIYMLCPQGLNGDADCFILGSSIGFSNGTNTRNKPGMSVFSVLYVGRGLLWEHVAFG